MRRSRHEKKVPHPVMKLPILHQIQDILDVWQVVKEYSRKPTCGEEMGWPEWRQWF